jgi:hypothetical protein
LPRLLSTLLVLGLLGGTAAAFAVTERLKLVPSPIVAPRVTEAFSPVCGCETAEASIDFTLRDADRVSVSILDADDDEVAIVAEGDPHGAGPVSFGWTGSGAPEGEYRARVHLDEARRTIVIPNRIRLDTTPPVVTVESIEPRVFSPDRDSRSDVVHVTYAVSERSSVLLYVEGERAVESPPRERGKLDWRGGRERRPGTFALTVGARDLAGNEAAHTSRTAVRLRYIELSQTRLTVPAGIRFGVRVSTDARSYTWRLGARRGVASTRSLVLRAPQRPGRYTLRVSYPGHSAAIPVFVRPTP